MNDVFQLEAIKLAPIFQLFQTNKLITSTLNQKTLLLFHFTLKTHSMISTKKLIKMARKWQKIAAASRKRISWPRSVANEGHFVVYTTNGRRFMIPLAYLKTEVFIELFRIAEEQFGITSSGPITLPCDSKFMEYVISVVQRCASQDLEQALMVSLTSCRHSALLQEHQEQISSHLLICSF
ncbi:unnamed protein product [Amaranthus hypochondriacus]